LIDTFTQRVDRMSFWQGKTSSGFPATAVVPVPGHQFAMPAENRVRIRNVRQMLEHLPSENPAFDGQAPTLVVVEQDSALSELLSQNSILGQEVLDGVLLSAVDPGGEDQEQQMPWLKLSPHVPPRCVVEIRSIRDR
jgi:hypothetical protein